MERLPRSAFRVEALLEIPKDRGSVPIVTSPRCWFSTFDKTTHVCPRDMVEQAYSEAQLRYCLLLLLLAVKHSNRVLEIADADLDDGYATFASTILNIL
jgi:hypothetical protein